MSVRTSSIAALVVTVLAAGAYAQTYSDAQLLSEGKQAYARNSCVTAAKFFFAYLLRNPNDGGRAQLEGAISWCERNSSVGGGTKGDERGGIQPPPPVVFGRGRPDVTVVGPPPAMSSDFTVQRRCDSYARVAVAQAEAFSANRCGALDGGRWQTSYNNHFAWCASVGAGPAQSENTERQRLLNACTQ